MYCTECLKECEVIQAVVGVRGYVNEHEYGCVDVYGDVSDCCEAEVSQTYPGPICTECGEPSALACPECGEPQCVDCYGGGERVESEGPCLECALGLAKEGIYS